ncbi:MAG: hypothetical protein MUP55_04270 [Candidatus Aenigmarchaeota archaeon]|nr:hypothetical protein [Candidatus Aenigmarchaeota archaeon]
MSKKSDGYIGKSFPVKFMETRLKHLGDELTITEKNDGSYQELVGKYQSCLESCLQIAETLEPDIKGKIAAKYQL